MDTNTYKYFAVKVSGRLTADGEDFTQSTIFKYALVRRAMEQLADKFDGEIVNVDSDGNIEE